MDGAKPENNEKKKSVGILTDVLPAMAFNLIDTRVFPFDYTKEINSENLKKFIFDFLNNKLKPGAKQTMRQQNPEIEEKYKDTPYISADLIHSKILDEGTDVMLLIYDSSNKSALAIAPHYNRVARRFNELRINSLKVFRIDAAAEAVHSILGTYILPAILFFPSFHKAKPFVQFTGDATTVQMMFFAQKYADIKFELPELPHLSPDQVPAYWEQVAELDSEKRKKTAEANERRDWGDYF